MSNTDTRLPCDSEASVPQLGPRDFEEFWVQLSEHGDHGEDLAHAVQAKEKEICHARARDGGGCS